MVARRPCTALLLSVVAVSPISAFSDRSVAGSAFKSVYIQERRRFLGECAAGAFGTIGVALRPTIASAANLPKSTGADFGKTGTVETLIPITKTRDALQKARAKLGPKESSAGLSGDLVSSIAASLDKIPSDEMTFKRMFDEYSDPVSYKQKFMDANAFLVYYTDGFDGPNRPKMEDGEVPRQTLQYGSRNDAWSSFDELLVELKFAKSGGSSSTDVLDPLDRTIGAFDAYLLLAPPADVAEAKRIIIN